MKKIAWLCVMATLVTSAVPQVVLANEVEEHDERIIEVNENDEIKNISDMTLNDADVIVMEEDTYRGQNPIEVQEFLDNGSNILVTGVGAKVVGSESDNHTKMQTPEGNVVTGYWIQCVGDELLISPIEYALMEEEDTMDKKTEEEAYEILMSIAHQEAIEPELVLEKMTEPSTRDVLEELDDDTVAKLQTGLELADSFASNSRLAFYYKKTNMFLFSEPGVKYSDANTVSGYAKIGSIRLKLYAISMGSKGTKTFDLIFGECTASGLNNHAVEEFEVTFDVSYGDNCELSVAYEPDNAAEYTASVYVGSDSNGFSSAFTGSYTYTTGDLKSINQNGIQSLTELSWTCVAPIKENTAFSVKPAILLEKSDGKNTPVTITYRVSHLIVQKQNFYYYESSNNCGTYIMFQNHTEYNP